MQATVLNKARCPVCGARNDCGMATGAASADGCWCRDHVVDAQALEQLVPAGANQSCLCPRCLALATVEAVNR